MLVYVSGPISGHENGNIQAFRAAEAKLTSIGCRVIVPHDVPPALHGGPCPTGYAQPHSVDYPEHTSTACFISGDLRALLLCGGIYMLSGWERSVGARAEFDVAAITGIKIYYENQMGLDDLRVVS